MAAPKRSWQQATQVDESAASFYRH
eukprot:SAG25_NODE_11450_length_304_cov_0.746341_1_plen_24_part_01